MQNDRLTLIRQLAIFQFLGVGGVSLEGSGGSEFDGVDGGFGELVRREINKIRRCRTQHGRDGGGCLGSMIVSNEHSRLRSQVKNIVRCVCISKDENLGKDHKGFYTFEVYILER